MIRRLISLLVASMAVTWVLCAGPATASSVSVHLNEEGFKVLEYAAAAGETNRLDVNKYDWLANKYEFDDRNGSGGHNTITPGAGCVTGYSSTVDCDPGGDVDFLVINTGDGDDLVTVGSGLTTGANRTWFAAAYLGSGDDSYSSYDLALADSVDGEAGVDGIETRGGDDTIDGGPDNDAETFAHTITGLNGGAGSDFIAGGDGDDIIDGGDGNDRRLDGGPGNDRITGGAGDDDPVLGGDGNDVFEGSTFGRHPGGGADAYFGQAGNDVLYASDGDPAGPVSPDAFFGDYDPDALVGDPQPPAGIDRVDYSGRDRGTETISVSIDGLANDGQAGEGDFVDYDIENLTGTYAGTDELIGDAGPNVLSSGLFSDSTMFGGSGNDTLLGFVGRNIADGGPGVDSASLGANADEAYFADGVPGETVACGGDSDYAELDAADTASECETVVRPSSATPTPTPTAAPGALPTPTVTTTATATPTPTATVTITPTVAPRPNVTTMPTPGAAGAAGLVIAGSNLGTVSISRAGSAPLPGVVVGCLPASPGNCPGSATVVRSRTVLARAALSLAPGTRSGVRVRLTAAGRRALAAGRSLRASVAISVGSGNGLRTKTAALRLKRALRRR